MMMKMWVLNWKKNDNQLETFSVKPLDSFGRKKTLTEDFSDRRKCHSDVKLKLSNIKEIKKSCTNV